MIRTNLFHPSLEVTVLPWPQPGHVLGTAGPCRASLSDCIDATCRITTAEGSRGSGCVFEIGKARSTCSPPPTSPAATPARCNANSGGSGHQSSPLAGRVIGRSGEADAAVVAVPAGRAGRPAARRRPPGPAGRRGPPRRHARLGRLRERELVHRLEGPRPGQRGGRVALRPRAGQRTQRLGPL